MKKTITWILIANGAQARVLENTGPGKGLTLVQGLNWEVEPLQAREINADRPGRTLNGGMEPKTDPVDHREAEFVKGIAAVLERKCQEGAFDRLVISADPISLGTIRKAISPQLKKCVVADLPKDLTNIPTPQLGQHFDGIIAT